MPRVPGGRTGRAGKNKDGILVCVAEGLKPCHGGGAAVCVCPATAPELAQLAQASLHPGLNLKTFILLLQNICEIVGAKCASLRE